MEKSGSSNVLCLMLFVIVTAVNGFSAYQPNWESLSSHQAAPEWLKDAKLGIYFHWGVYSVPAFGSEWYPRNMHLKGDWVSRHHIETYGDPTEFGYHDFVPMFKAEKFDAQEWTRLFKAAGAKFAGPVAEHHDGFSMWDSDATPWNAMDKGPKRDIVGEMAEALRNNDMKLITTFHHARNNLWSPRQGRWTGHYSGVKENWPSLLDDPENAILYGYMPRDQFLEMWMAKLVEVIDHYQPDIIWFDSWLDEIPEKTRQEFCTYYLNQAEKWDKDVAIVRKQNDLPLSVSINDHEKSREPKALPDLWMTDDTISTGSWCYTENLKIKSLHKVVHSVVDTVSKNGVVLLNVSPMADGTIPQDQRGVLLGLGEWLKVNGEAIYATRPWKVAGQGPTIEPSGGFGDAGKFLQLEYTPDDIRLTQSKDGKTLYVICLGWPEKAFKLKVVSVGQVADDARVSLIGSDEKTSFTVNSDKTLTIQPPVLGQDQRPCPKANSYVFKLEGFELDLNADQN